MHGLAENRAVAVSPDDITYLEAPYTIRCENPKCPLPGRLYTEAKTPTRRFCDRVGCQVAVWRRDRKQVGWIRRGNRFHPPEPTD